MKKVLFTFIALTFSISLCMAQQSILDVKKKQERSDSIQRVADKEKRQREAQLEEERKRNAEILYQNTVESAEKNFEQKRYKQAKQDYLTAIDLKPEKAASFNSKIAEIDKLLLEELKERTILESERLYQEVLVSAQRNFEQRLYEDAKKDYQKALELKPENADLILPKIADLNKPAQLHIYSKGTLLGLLWENYNILLDEEIVGRTNNKWKITVTVNDLSPKTLSAAIDGRKAVVNINYEPGKTYYVRAGISSNTVKTGEIKTRKKRDGTTERYEDTRIEYTPVLQLMSESVGEREFNAIKNK